MDFQDSIFPRITSGVEFETEIMTFLQRIGFKAYKTGSNDGGVDIIAKHTTKKREYVFYIQCKFFNKPVGKHPIQEIYAGSHYYVGNGKPVLVTNNTVTYEARMYAHRLGVEVIARPEFEVIIGLISHKLTEVINQYKGLMGMIVAVLLNDKSYYQKVVNAENTELPDEKEQARLQIISEYDEAEECEKEAAQLEAKASKYRQRSLAIQKKIALRNFDYG